MFKKLIASALLFASFGALAGDFDFPNDNDPQNDRADFDAITRDLTAALSYKAAHPAETGGVAGIEIAALVSYSPTEDDGAWRRLAGTEVDEVGMVGLRAIKGLPLGLEVGAFLSVIPGTGAKLFGAEFRYAIVDGGVATPSVALRASATRLQGADNMDFESKSADISVSKGFALLTPYAGIGRVWADTEAVTGGAAPNTTIRQSSNHEATRVFAGARIGLGLFDITPEFERIGSNGVFTLLFGMSI